MGVESSVLSWLLILILEIRNKKNRAKGTLFQMAGKNTVGLQGISWGTNLI